MNRIVHRQKLRLGAIYGIVAGFAFAVFAWGADAWLLARAHSIYYYVKFVPGLLICITAGAVAGWLTIALQKHSLAILFWGMLAGLFTWTTVWLPFTGSALIINMLDPNLAKWFSFSQVDNLNQFILISLVFIGLASIIGGLLEMNLVDQAVMSPYISGIVVALLVCTVLFGLAGSGADHMINSNLREPVLVVNNMLQFAEDNAGVEVPKATARAMHLSAAKALGDLVEKSRQLLLIGFDSSLGTMSVLVNFQGTQARCNTIYSQPTDCIILTSNP